MCLAAACLTRPECWALLFLVVPVVVWRQGRRTAWMCSAPLFAAVAFQLLLNDSRYGSPFSFGYGNETFSNDPLSGLAHLLADPRKSVIIFAPIVVLVPVGLRLLWRTHREAFVLLAGGFAVITLISATWDSWQGGWSWGPRLLLPGLLPALAAVAAWIDVRPSRRRVVLITLALGFAVSASTVLVPTQAQQLDRPPPAVGPGVVRQIELIGPTLSYTFHHALTPTAADRQPGVHRRFVNTHGR